MGLNGTLRVPARATCFDSFVWSETQMSSLLEDWKILNLQTRVRFPVALPNLLGVNPQCLCGPWCGPVVFFPVFLVLIRLSRALGSWTVNGQ